MVLQEKVKKVLDIWSKAATFGSSTLSRIAAKISSDSGAGTKEGTPSETTDPGEFVRISCQSYHRQKSAAGGGQHQKGGIRRTGTVAISKWAWKLVTSVSWVATATSARPCLPQYDFMFVFSESKNENTSPCLVVLFFFEQSVAETVSLLPFQFWTIRKSSSTDCQRA